MADEYQTALSDRLRMIALSSKLGRMSSSAPAALATARAARRKEPSVAVLAVFKYCSQ